MFEPILQSLAPFSQEFSRRGKSVYLVGGAVRNLLLGRPVKDYDFATDALPQEVQGFFRKVLPTGLQHGTVTVLFQGQSFEVTTFRTDGDYTDGRRPDAVTFTPSLEEDLKRRDFTINAMAVNLADGTLTDPHDGQGDLARKVLRAIGDPGKRFDEDALRLLRLFRFAAQLGFSIDPATMAAVPSRRPNLAAVSRERIREELAKTLGGPHPALGWRPLQQLGFLADLFAPLEPLPLEESGWDRLQNLPPELRWAFWLTISCGTERKGWERVLKRLTFSNVGLDEALGPARAWAVLEQDLSVPVKAKAVIDLWGDRRRIAPGNEYLTALKREGYWNDPGVIEEIARVAGTTEPVFLRDLAIGGETLLSEGVSPGPSVGRVLKALQRRVWSEPDLNTPDRLRSLIPSLR